MRVDLFLVENGHATSRTRAQELIAKGRVFVLSGGNKKIVTKSSLKIGPGETLQVERDEGAGDFVSRGGTKMRAALMHCGLEVRDLCVLDVGISTGGFTDCLLQGHARSVVGVDVGHAQLAKKLAADARVSLLEGVNARELSRDPHMTSILKLNHGQKFDLVVIDVSFISLTMVLPETVAFLNESASILALVKPQFEVGQGGLGKNGIVKDPALYQGVENKIRECVGRCGLVVEAYFASAIDGGDGNREFFVLARSAQMSFGAVCGMSSNDQRQ